MPEKNKTILSEEESFARRVALGVVVRRPVKAWMQLIPGMFIFDFLKRTQEIRRFSEYYLHPRRLALQALDEITGGAHKDDALSHIKEPIREWLTARKLYSDSAVEAQMRSASLLIDHYARLVQSHGDTFFALIRDAYENQTEFDAFLSQLNFAEREACQAIAEKAPANDRFWKELPARHRQTEEYREKDSEAIYFGR